VDKAHSRREFFEAQTADPQGVHEALKRISALYAIEDDIRTLELTGEAKRLHRLTHSKPHVEVFFAWVDRRLEEHELRPATPFTHALNYVRERRLGLEVFLTDPDVPMDTNHLERSLRAIPMGRKYPRIEIMEASLTVSRRRPTRVDSMARHFSTAVVSATAMFPDIFKSRTLHNYSACRKRSTWSLGRYRSGVRDGGRNAFSARSFICKSAST
jgi:Transposase IS66 family